MSLKSSNKISSPIYLLAILLACACPAAAQPWQALGFGKEVGIKGYELKNLMQDKNGFIWLLYGDKLQRFDGQEATTELIREGMIDCILTSRNEFLINTSDSLWRYHPISKNLKAVSPPPTKAKLGRWLISNQQAFLLTSQGVWQLSENDRWHKVNLTTKEPIDLRIASSNGSKAYVATVSEVYCLEKEVVKKRIPFPQIQSIVSVDDSLLILSNWRTEAYLVNLNSGLQTRLYHPTLPKLSAGFLTVYAAVQRESFTILATNTGLLKLQVNQQQTTRLTELQVLLRGVAISSKSYAQRLLCDRENRLWCHGETGLLKILHGRQQIGLLRSAHDPPTGWNDDVRHFTTDGKGHLWMATLHGFAQLNTQTMQVQSYQPIDYATGKYNHPSVRGIALQGVNLIIGQTNKGIRIYNTIEKHYKEPLYASPPVKTLLENEFIYRIQTLYPKQHLVIGKTNLYLLEGEHFSARLLNTGLPEQTVHYTALQTRDRRIIIGANNGCWQISLTDSTCTQISNKRTHSLYECADGRILRGGQELDLIDLKNKTVQTLNLPRKKTVQICFEDKNKFIWSAFNEELVRINPSDNSIHEMTYQSNIAGDYFKPDSIEPFISPYPTAITGIATSAKLINDTLLESSYPWTPSEILLATPNYTLAGPIFYRYRLSGLSDHFENLGTNQRLFLAELPPGAYRLEIQVSYDKNTWLATNANLSIKVATPLIQQLWFRLLCFILISTGIWIYAKGLRQKLMEQRILNYFATSLYGRNTIEEVFWDIAKNCITQLGFEDCIIYQYDDDKKVLIQKAAFGPKNPVQHEILNPIEIPLGNGITGWVALHKKSQIVADTALDERYIVDDQVRRSEITIPILAGDRLIGIIDSEHSKPNFFKQRHLRLLTKIAEQCTLKLSTYLTEERLRGKIARDLHDEIGSTLTGIHISSKIAKTASADVACYHLEKIHEQTGRIMENMSDIVWAINPSNDTLPKLISRMQDFATEILEPAGITHLFEREPIFPTTTLDLEKRRDFYLIFKEALTNIAKHSQATHCHIQLLLSSSHLNMLIADNGIGIPTNIRQHGNGLRNMLYRAKQLGGHLSIHSNNPGTRILFDIKLTSLGDAKQPSNV